MLIADKEAEREIEVLIAKYENPKFLSPKSKKILINEVINPFLEAFTAFRLFAIKATIKEDIVEMLMYLNFE